jgi:hypothetical protein
MNENDEKIDALIIEAANDHWTKIAVIISKVYDHYEQQGLELSKGLAQEIAERLYILVDNGQLDVQGNMRRWRDADVKKKKPR